MANINIGGRLHSTATGNTVAGANEILDDSINKKQSEINAETYRLVENINNSLENLNPEQTEALSVAKKANNNEVKLGYFECETESDIAAKVITNASGYILSKGGSIKIKMINDNIASNVTLNINSTGAKTLYYNNKLVSPTNTWKNNEIIEVYYDGNNYYANNIECIEKFATGEKIKEVGIDDKPTAESENLVKSRGVHTSLKELESETNTKIAGLFADMCWTSNPHDELPFTQDYEEGLQDCYIDSNKIQNISKILIQCYILKGIPCLYIRYKSNTGEASYLVSAVPFSNINNFEQFNIFKDNECVGYVIFKDKQKFIDNPRNVGIPLNLKKVLRGNVLNGFSVTTKNIQDNCITTAKVVNDSITTEKIADKGVTADKTDFVEVRTGDQLYDKSSMGVTGSWYYFSGGGQGIGKEVSLITNEYTGIYTAIKIPYKGQNKITLSQDIPKQNGALLYSYYIVDTNMRVIAYQTAVQAHLIDGYTITIETNQNAAYLLLNVSNCNEESFMINEGDVVLPYEPYQKYTYINGIKITNDKVVSKEEIDISLPDTIHAVVGDTLQLFYRGMVKAVNPYNYNILVNCIKGKQYPRYYEFTPTSEDVGSVPFKITIKDNNRNVIAEKSCIINVVNVASSPISVKKIACFGDSLTYNGAWVAEAYRRLTQNGGSPVANGLSNIEFVGAREKNGARYFGEGGWTWDSYTTKGIKAYRFQVNNVLSLSMGSRYTNNGNTFTILEINITDGSGNILCSVSSLTPAPSASGTLIKSSGTGDNNITFTSYSQDSANPLWDSNANKMTFIPYANKYANGNIDIVYTLLSWNSQTPGKEDFSDVIAKIKIFADTLHTEFPNAKLKIMGIQVPSVNGGMGANYGATGTSYSDGYGMVVTVLNQNKAYQDFANSEGYKDFVEFVNVSAEFDTEYNMPYSEVNVNTRSTIKEKRGTNGVHPSNEGYLQIADVVYRNIMANL